MQILSRTNGSGSMIQCAILSNGSHVIQNGTRGTFLAYLSPGAMRRELEAMPRQQLTAEGLAWLVQQQGKRLCNVEIPGHNSSGSAVLNIQ